MARAEDPTLAMREQAAAVEEGTSCSQASFKVGKTAFFYVGPGAKGQGFKAMFKLQRSIPQAEKLAAKAPDRLQLGSNSWVTARFTSERPLAKSVWTKWLRESYNLAQLGPAKKTGAKTGAKTAKKTAPKRKAKKKVAQRSVAQKKTRGRK